MKILWFSNRLIDDIDTGNTGTWLTALANILSKDKSVTLSNITFGNSAVIKRSESNRVLQFEIPSNKTRKNGLPTSQIKKEILKIIYELKPNLIHVWGTESYWGTITAGVTKDFPVLIEIQGLKKTISNVYKGELTFKERLKCIGLKELLKRDFLQKRKKDFEKWGQIEVNIIQSHFYFSTHSLWAESKVRAVNQEVKMYKNERVLRADFYNSSKWKPVKEPILFTSLGYPAPFKGLYTLIKSVEILKIKYPSIKLYIAGNFKTKGIRKDGYINFIINQINSRNLKDNVVWTGGLNSTEIIGFLKRSSVAIYPSFNESYGLALIESMAVGTPVVSAFNGGYGYNGKDEETVLFFSPGDFEMCAFQINRIIECEKLAISLSVKGRNFILDRNESSKIFKKQIEIYKNIINLSKTV